MQLAQDQLGKMCKCLMECRLYIPDDIEYIEQDLEQLKGLFLADGQGLPAEDVDSLCAPVVDLLNVLQLETGILIKNFKDVSFSCLPVIMPLLKRLLLCMPAVKVSACVGLNYLVFKATVLSGL